MIGAAATVACDVWKAVFWIALHGTVLALVAGALAATVLRRARPAVIAALWSVVLLKFVVPIGPALPWSISTFLDGIVGGSHATAPALVLPAKASATGAATAPGPAMVGVVALVGLGAWAALAAVLLTRRVRAHRALARRAAALPLAAAPVVAEVAAVARRLGLRHAPVVRIDDGSAVPWVLGVGRATLVLPATLGPGPERDAVVGHELAHLRRRDAWLRLVQVVAGAVFCWFPVVRLVNRRIDAARELACDAWAIERGPLGAAAYARVLVRLARRAHDAPAPAAALALAAHPHLLGRRVDALLARGRRPRAGVGAIGLVALVAWGLLALGAAPSAEARTAAPLRDCHVSPSLAAQILQAYPEADTDGDGRLTRAEACEFQLEFERLVAEAPVSMPAPLADELSPDALRLQCGAGGDTSVSPAAAPELPAARCTQD